jgi:hypothetical protein
LIQGVSEVLASVNYTANAAMTVAGASAIIAAARKKWEDEPDVGEVWVDVPEESEIWTPVSDTGETWTHVR